MNQYKVLIPFIDEETGKGYNEGHTFTSENGERVSFLISEGYLKGETSKVDEGLLAEAKELKIKGYTKMNEEALREAIDAVKAKEASEEVGK